MLTKDRQLTILIISSIVYKQAFWWGFFLPWISLAPEASAFSCDLQYFVLLKRCQGRNREKRSVKQFLGKIGVYFIYTNITFYCLAPTPMLWNIKIVIKDMLRCKAEGISCIQSSCWNWARFFFLLGRWKLSRTDLQMLRWLGSLYV